MNVLGLDVGFSATKETCALCLLSVDPERQEIGLVEWPKRFLLKDARRVFLSMSEFYMDIKWVSMDAPLTPTRLSVRPEVGRSVDKRFSRGAFSSSQGGPQPGETFRPAKVTQ
jgi:hypothetical protein